MKVVPTRLAPLGRGAPGGRLPRAAPFADRLELVVAAQQAIALAAPTVDVLVEVIVEQSRRLLEAPATAVCLVEGDRLVLVASNGSLPMTVGDELPLDDSLAGVALRTGRSQVCYDALTDTRAHQQHSRIHGVRSSVLVPLVRRGRSIGVVAALSGAPRAFSEADRQLLTLLGEISVTRLDHARAVRDELASRAALVASELQLAGVLHALDEGILVVRADGSVVLGNPAAARILGCSEADLCGRNVYDPAWGTLFEDATPCPADAGPVSTSLRTGVLRREVVGLHRADDGARRWVSVTSVPLRDAPDEPVTGAAVSLVDVTDERKRALSLRDSEERFRIAFDNAPIGMGMLSFDPQVPVCYLRANAAFCQMLGRRTEGVVGRPLAELTHPDDVAPDLGRLADLHSGRHPTLSFEKRFLHADGHAVPVWVTTSVAYADDGSPLYLVSHYVDITEQRAQRAELERLALTDTLTGLANRALLQDRLAHALSRLARESTHHAVLLLDIDRFKVVNDSLGHQVGDALLVEVAQRLRQVVREGSTVARLGGDEFVVLLEDLSRPEDVHAVARRVLDEIRRPFTAPQQPVVVTASMGVAVVGEAGRGQDDVYREADLALYRAKDAGRDRYALFDDELRARAVDRLDAEGRLRRALADGRLLVRVQPIVDLATGRIVGAEALVRVDDPERGVLGPDRFIELAEDTGLITEIDDHVAEVAVALAADPNRLGLGRLAEIAVNVSARSLETAHFPSRLQAALLRHGLPAERLSVELTERTLLDGTAATRASMDRLAAMGLRLGLDDFGTGYSSLSYLQRFALDFLKIDQSFVAQLGTDPRATAIVRGVVDLAHALGMLVVAEGVERPDQLAALRRLGCDRAQGYLFGRPMSPANLADLARQARTW